MAEADSDLPQGVFESARRSHTADHEFLKGTAFERDPHGMQKGTIETRDALHVWATLPPDSQRAAEALVSAHVRAAREQLEFDVDMVEASITIADLARRTQTLKYATMAVELARLEDAERVLDHGRNFAAQFNQMRADVNAIAARCDDAQKALERRNLVRRSSLLGARAVVVAVSIGAGLLLDFASLWLNLVCSLLLYVVLELFLVGRFVEPHLTAWNRRTCTQHVEDVLDEMDRAFAVTRHMEALADEQARLADDPESNESKD